MTFDDLYRRHVALLVRILPLIAEEEDLALKGGTAINLFVRDMPRMSIDIDLTYLPIAPRHESLVAIDSALKRIAQRVRSSVVGANVYEVALATDATVIKLVVRAGGVQVKIEVSPVLRGCVGEPEMRAVSSSVEEGFGYAEMRLLSFPDLYGGKIMAALDRQHPRDLFDVRDLLANEGIDDDLRRTFIVYLLSHNRPMSEVLAPTFVNITREFDRGFRGMTAGPISLEDLTRAREDLVVCIVGDMPIEHREFLLSFERGEPRWSLLGLHDIDRLPAVRWRQQNLDRLDRSARAALVARLEDVFRQVS